ncbi:expressed unknown protein [Seminavis robusta]|uniref:Uncharacterized protein n=1 Tax=Seminavis robusta TaxID=568900 RepID=A0A9N8HP89_9STRA|nr:expressed unknown protein [Seminavis robusta]|eukprot:Sro1156_g247250.1 n/a (276) ;mRNA; f:8663-9608
MIDTDDKNPSQLIYHAVPGAGFLLAGLLALIVLFFRMKQCPPDQTLQGSRNPCRDKKLLGPYGLLVMALAAGGCFWLGTDYGNFFHQVLFMCYFMAALVAFLESRERVASGWTQPAIALASFLIGFLWTSHGLHKTGMINSRVHVYAGLIDLSTAAAFAYSSIQDSFIAQVAGWALIMLQGVWMFYIGLFFCCIDINHHLVEAHLVFAVLAVTVMIILVIAAADFPKVRNTHQGEEGGDYRVVSSSTLEESEAPYLHGNVKHRATPRSVMDVALS